MSSKEVQAYILEHLNYPHFVEEKRAIAKILMLDKYGISAIDIISDEKSDIEISQLEADLLLLNNRVPVQHVVGFTYFLDRKFSVSGDVLIPRPETEELVSLLLTEFRPDIQNPTIVDIGTGSGCIAISLALGIRDAEVSAFDISENALAIAKENAFSNKAKVDFQLFDILKEQNTNLKKFDVIVSNPPYVKENEQAEMEGHVLDHEPHLALFVPDHDPLIFYRAIAAFAFKNLNKNGLLAFEINSNLGLETQKAIEEQGFEDSIIRKDFFGKDRFIFAKK